MFSGLSDVFLRLVEAVDNETILAAQLGSRFSRCKAVEIPAGPLPMISKSISLIEMFLVITLNYQPRKRVGVLIALIGVQ